MRVSAVHTIAGIAQDAGGVARSVPGLCEALHRAGCRTILVTQRPRGVPAAQLRVPGGGVETRLVDGFNWSRWRASYTPGLGGHVARACHDAAPCVIHNHGMWLHSDHVAAAVARRERVPLVVSPRGMLEGWSLRYRAGKKALAWRLYQRRDLGTASAFSVTSVDEARSLRSLGLEQPIAVIPNGVDVPQSRERRRGAVRSVLFLSRIHPKKGLLDLVVAWRRAACAGWELVIAGPDEAGHRRDVEAAIAVAGLGSSVRFTGAVEGAAKEALMRAADVFVLPSHSENFGIAVAEALAHGVPAIATTATPWASLDANGCGWCVPPGPATIAEALGHAMSLDDRERDRMGELGRAWVERELSWDAIAARHVELYRWLLGFEPRRPHWLFT